MKTSHVIVLLMILFAVALAISYDRYIELQVESIEDNWFEGFLIDDDGELEQLLDEKQWDFFLSPT
jgi:hypothetical protein